MDSFLIKMTVRLCRNLFEVASQYTEYMCRILSAFQFIFLGMCFVADGFVVLTVRLCANLCKIAEFIVLNMANG